MISGGVNIDADALAQAEIELNGAVHAVGVLDANGCVLDFSARGLLHFGWSDSIVGSSIFELIHRSDEHRFAIELIRLSESPNDSVPAQVLRFVCGDTTRDVEVITVNQLANPKISGIVVSLRDVSGRPVNDRAIAAGDYLYQSLAAVPSDGTTIFDVTGKRVYASSSLASLLGYTMAELTALGPAGLVFADDVHLWKSATRQALHSAEGSARVECRIMHKDGTPRWMETTVVNLLNDAGVRGVVAHVRDIDDRRRLEDELRRRASLDSLTGLSNRDVLHRELAELHEGRLGHGVFFLDLDGFKSVNDRFGHGAGDRLLVVVARALETVLAGRADLLAISRLGGDEFCVLTNEMTEADAFAVGVQIRESILLFSTQSLRSEDIESSPIGVSIGIALATKQFQDGDSLRRADAAMYEAKALGPNNIKLTYLGATPTAAPQR